MIISFLFQQGVKLHAKGAKVDRKKDGNQIGSDFEALVYDCLRIAANELDVKNTVVFSGLILKDKHSNPFGEIDFLIVSNELKAVIQVNSHKINFMSRHCKYQIG